MADQLLSQADVDALVSSLTRSEPAKPVAAANPAPARSTAAGAGLNNASQSVTKTPQAGVSTAVKPSQTGGALPGTASRPSQSAKPVQSGGMAARPVQSGGMPGTARPVQSARSEPKPDMSPDIVNSMNAKIADLSKQLAQMGTALKRIELLEKKAAELENKIAQDHGTPATTQRVQELSEAVKKISVNLRGTPGYGVKHTFNCEKCSDHGHVAVKYRCTKCGHERWYGWWPEKK